MLVIACSAGLGNQMFQYAFYCQKKYNLKNVKLDLSTFDRYIPHNGYELEKLFNLDIVYASKDDCIIAGKPTGFLSRIINKRKGIYYYPNSSREAITFSKKLYNKSNGYLFGYWQSEKYFVNCSEEVRNSFVFKNPLDERNLKIKEKIQNENSISIHIRRGDYLKCENKIFQNICTLNYYKNAIEYMNKFVERPIYYIFSNDIEWCRKNLKIKNATYVDWNVGKESYKDMQLMSYCKHNIIANSSFSWWGAWLNSNPNKVVCVPERWFDLPGCETKDVCPNEWIRIKIK